MRRRGRRRGPSARALVERARSLDIEIPTGYLPDGYSLQGMRSSEVPSELVDWMLSCVRDALQPMYTSSSMGWNEETKRNELTASAQQFIIAKINGANAGFVSYMYDLENREAVLYVYELYVAKTSRRSGLGVALMRTTEDVARAAGIPKIMLTTFVDNAPAMRLYRDKLRYVNQFLRVIL